MGSYNATRRIDQVLSTQGDGTGTIQSNIASKTITGATTASPTVVTSASHGYSDGDYVLIAGATGTTEINGLHVVSDKTANTFQLKTPDGVYIGSAGTFGGTVTSYLAFLIKPASTETYEIVRFNLAAGDATNPTNQTYLGVATLTNGVTVEVRNSAGIIQTLTPSPVKGWNYWTLAAGVDTPQVDLTAGHVDGAVRWTFTKTGPSINLRGSAGEFLVMTINDALSGLTYHVAAVQGETV